MKLTKLILEISNKENFTDKLVEYLQPLSKKVKDNGNAIEIKSTKIRGVNVLKITFRQIPYNSLYTHGGAISDPSFITILIQPQPSSFGINIKQKDRINQNQNKNIKKLRGFKTNDVDDITLQKVAKKIEKYFIKDVFTKLI